MMAEHPKALLLARLLSSSGRLDWRLPTPRVTVLVS
jgi:hypothetical protein